MPACPHLLLLRRRLIFTHIGRRDFDIAGIFPEDLLVIDVGFDEESLSPSVLGQQNLLVLVVGSTSTDPHLDIVLGELLGQGNAAAGGGVDSVVDGDLALVVQPVIDIISAPLEDLLAKEDRGRRRIRIKVVLRDISSFDTSPTVVAQVEDACLYAEPVRG